MNPPLPVLPNAPVIYAYKTVATATIAITIVIIVGMTELSFVFSFPIKITPNPMSSKAVNIYTTLFFYTFQAWDK